MDCGRPSARIAGSNPAGGIGTPSVVGVVCCQVEVSTGGICTLSVVGVVCCQVEVSASDRSPVQRSPTECGVS
jgi:hypothetical protein